MCSERIPNPGIEQRRARHVYCIRYFRFYLFNSRDNSKNKYQNNTIVRQSTALLSASHKRAEHKAFGPPSSPTKLLNNTVRKKIFVQNRIYSAKNVNTCVP